MIDLADIFLTDFAQLGFGSLDRNRIELAQDQGRIPTTSRSRSRRPLAAATSAATTLDGDGADRRHAGTTHDDPLQPGKTPDAGYHPRTPTTGSATSSTPSRTSAEPDPDTDSVRMINRWRLEKADPKAKLSPPKKQIVWYIEDTVPEEYRPSVEAGHSRMEQGVREDRLPGRDRRPLAGTRRDDFDPEDINYCTFRWITTGSTFAMSGLRGDPMTGEMIDGDVIFDASWISLEGRIRLPDGRARRPRATGADPSTGMIPLAMGRSHQPDHGGEARLRASDCPLREPPRRALNRHCSGSRAAAPGGARRWPSTLSPPAGTRFRLTSSAA